jgi:alpha-amylase
MMRSKTRCTGAGLSLGLAMIAALSVPAHAQNNQNYLQWFETEWDRIERRVPDFFLAGYNAVWLPPPSKTSGFHSPGYDPFDRFDLGKPPLFTTATNRARTTYGTEATFRAMVQELHRANAEVAIDAILNHNSGRTESDFFLSQGGWPGFWIPRENPPRNKQPTDNWGDFNNGNANGYLQSENPGGPNYNLVNGDLVALIDIAHQSNNAFIRQPVAAGDPLNIPGGSIWNLPDPANTRFYPDLSLTPDSFTNPGTARNPGAQAFTRHPFNISDPMAGDAVPDNATGLLMRWSQWMVQEMGVDAFRLDAGKHAPSWFWDRFFDSAIHMSRATPDGRLVNPFTFGENVTGNGDNLANYIRKDSFANRDALDLQGAGKLRDLLNGGGLGSWANIQANGDSGHLDVSDDGIVNGSMGVNHVFSHDNGSVGGGGSLPSIPSERQQGHQMHAYMLMRPGRAIVYHHGRGIPRTSGFFPREGAPKALGWDPIAQSLDDTVTTLVRLRNQIGYGQYFQLNSNIADVLVYQRAFNGRANCVVAVNDRWDSGTIGVTVNTAYPQGTRLHEMTGNAADPAVNPGSIPQTITVGPGGQITLTVPNNRTGAVEHGKGYVIYAEALPDAAVSFIGAQSVIEPDPVSFPDSIQRLNPITVLTGDSFTIDVVTQAADPLDPNTDDNALFAWNQRNRDWNGNGALDIPFTASVIGGYEEFLTLNSPLYDSGSADGRYQQVIDATQMDEGFHYLSVIAFRHRPAGTTPLFREVRKVVYIDRLPPEIGLVEAGHTLTEARPEFTVRALDPTARRIHMFIDLPTGSDPLALVDTSNQVPNYDRREWRRTFDPTLSHGFHEVTVVAFEDSGNHAVLRESVFIDRCGADFNKDGVLNFFDISAYLAAFNAQHPSADIAEPFGTWNFFDLAGFISLYNAGCP